MRINVKNAVKNDFYKKLIVTLVTCIKMIKSHFLGSSYGNALKDVFCDYQRPILN